MSELLKKYESIDQSKLNEATIKIINRVKTITADFTADDEKNNKIAEQVLDSVMQKNPDAVKIVKREPKAKPAPKKTHKATHTAKATHKATSAPATKNSDNNIMTVAKQIQNAGESWKDAMERAKVVLKQRKEKVVEKKKTELEKLYALVKTKKELQGFANSDIKRDAVRTAKVKGARFVSKEGSTSNAYGTFPNKIGRKYWETRDRHSDRLAPNYPKDMPLLAKGGGVDSRYVIRFEDSKGNKESMRTDAYNKAEAMKVGKFFEGQAQFKGFKVVSVSEIEEEFANGGSTKKYRAGQKFYDTRYDRVCQIVPSNYDGLVTWKRYNKSGTEFENDTQHSLVEDQFDYLVNMGAYQISKQSMANGGEVAKSFEDIHSEVLDYLVKHKFTISVLGKNGDSIKIDDKNFTIEDQIIIEKINPKILISGSTNSPIWYIFMEKDAKMAKGGSVKKVPAYVKRRLEELREEILAERISYGEIAELESLKQYIDPSDVELLQWAGVPEFEEDEDNYAKGGKFKGFKFNVGDKVMVNSDFDYLNIFYKYEVPKTFEMGYDFSKPVTIVETKINSFNKPFYKVKTAPTENSPEGYIVYADLPEALLSPAMSSDKDSDVKIKDWYMKTYPTDDLGEELNDEVTFEDMWNEDYEKYDIYQVMGVGDSVIRERLFEHLAEIKGVTYSDVYRKLFSSDGFYADGGSLPFMTDPNFGNFQNTGSFANGGSIGDLTEQEFLKKYFGASVFTENPSQYFEIKKLSSSDDAKVSAFVKELKADGFTVKKRAYSDFTSVMGVKKKASFELGGAFMTTDLAGHTGGGTGGLNADMPLSGVTGTNYTGLVGETGAMSSGELFEAGGALHSEHTDNPLKYLSLMGAKTYGDLNYSTSKNGIDYYIGRKKDKNGENKAIVVAFITDENNYMIDKEDAKEMSETAKEKGVDKVELYTNYGVELRSSQKPQILGFDKIFKVMGNYEAGGVMAQNQQVINDASQSYVNYYLGEGAGQGIYKDGGSIPNNYEGRTPEDVWTNLTIEQRKHFLFDHQEELPERFTGYYVVNELAKRDFDNSPKEVQFIFGIHVETGQYAYGGKTKSAKPMKELYIEQIASLTGTRTVGVEKFVDDNNLNETELSNLMTGLGRGMINRGDFVTALTGEKGNSRQKEVIAFAKSDKAYKMADGGALKFKVGQGEKYFDKKEKMQLTIGKESDIPNVYNVTWEDGEHSIHSDDNINFLISKGVWKKLDKMADGGSVGDDFEEVIDLGSEQYYTRPFGIVESESKGEVELVVVATIRDLEDYMSEDELPEEGNFQLDITLVPTEQFISEEILESANDEDSSVSDNSEINLVNYAGGLNYSPQERVFFESHQDALDYLMSEELKEQINRDSFSSDYIMYKKYNRIGQTNSEYLDYLMGVTERFDKGGAIKNQYKDRTDKDIWNSFSVAQRQHFLKDHFEEIQTVATNSGINNINHFGNLIAWANRDYEDLPTYIKSPFNYHTESGQYAKGGVMAKGGMLVYLDGEKSKSFKTKKALYEFVRSQTGTGVKKVEIDYGNRIYPTFDTYEIVDGKLIHKGEFFQKNYDKEEAEKRRLETERRYNQFDNGGMTGLDYRNSPDKLGFADGGFVGTVEFNAGDTVWQKDEKRYATVMDNYGDPVNGSGGDIRLDTSGNTNIFTYDKKYNRTGYNLVKVGEKGDTGKFTPEVLVEMKESANRLIDSNGGRKDPSDVAYYKGIYKRLLDGEFDSMVGGAKATTSTKKGSSDYTYVPNKDVKELSVVLKGELKKLMGSDILDGVYVKNSAKSAPKTDANAVFAKILKDAKEAKVGKSKRFEASDLKKINLEMVQKLIEAGFTEQQVRNVIFGYAFDNEIIADNELEYDNGIFSYEDAYVESKVESLVEAQKNKEFAVGIEYPDFDWQGIIKKYKISSKPKDITEKQQGTSGSTENYYEVFVGDNIVIGHNYGYKWLDADGKVLSNYMEEDKKVSDPTKQNAWQKEREQKAGFNGGWWTVVSSKIEIIDDVLKTLLSQKGGYCKELDFYDDSFPKNLKENNIDFELGGFMNNVYAKGGTVGSYEVVIDGDWDEPKKFKTFSLAKKWIYDNVKNHDSLELVDSYGDTIYVEGNSTKEDLEWLFSNQDASFADGGFMNGVYADGGNIEEGSTITLKNDVYASYTNELIPKGTKLRLIATPPKVYGKNAYFVYAKTLNNKEEIRTDKSNFVEKIKELESSFADGGLLSNSQIEKLDRGFTIPQLNDMLDEMFPDSFRFEVYKQEQSTIFRERLHYEYRNKVQDDKLKLYFHHRNYGRDLNYEVYQGQENTFFKFQLVDEEVNTYVGTFGFKDEGDVDASYITKFISFLQDAFHYPLQVKHFVMADGGFMNDVYVKGGELQGKFLAEIGVPYNYEKVVEDKFGFTEFLSKTLTKKWFGNGVWGVTIVKPLFEKNYGQKIVVEIDIPLGVTQGGGLDKFDVVEFISKTLTKKWFGNGYWGVDVVKSFGDGGFMNNVYAKGGKIKVVGDDFSFLLDLSDKELQKRLDLVNMQKSINAEQYFKAKDKKENTSKIEEAGTRLDNQWYAIVEARIRKNKNYADGGEMQGNNIDAELEDFDIDNLDPFETMQYNQFVKSSGKVGALQVLINSVEGNYSELSPELAELAEMQMSGQEWEEQYYRDNGYADGGFMNDVYADGGAVGDMVSIELNNGKVITGKLEKINPIKIRTNETSTQVLPNALIKSIKKINYADGGEIYTIAENMSDDDYDKKFNSLNEKQKNKVTILIRLGDSPKLALATVIYGNFENDSDSDTYKLYSMADGGFMNNVYADGGISDVVKIGDTIFRAWFTNDYDGEKRSVIIVAENIKKAYEKAKLIDSDSFTYVSDGVKIKNEEQLLEETRENEPIYKYSDGGSFEDNYGFMKADNENNYRFPERPIHVDTLDEPIDLTDNVSYKSNEVVIEPVDQDMNMNEDGRIRARMTQSNRGSAENFAKINPNAFEFIPMPTSNKHKND